MLCLGQYTTRGTKTLDLFAIYLQNSPALPYDPVHHRDLDEKSAVQVFDRHVAPGDVLHDLNGIVVYAC